MYDQSSDTMLHGTGQETFEAVRMLKAANLAHYQTAGGAVYPNTPFGNSMKQIAQLLKANLGVEAAFADIGDGIHTEIRVEPTVNWLIAYGSSPTRLRPSGATSATEPSR